MELLASYQLVVRNDGFVILSLLLSLLLFLQAYYIFSIGNLKPIWSVEYPSCEAVEHSKMLTIVYDSNCVSLYQLSAIILKKLQVQSMHSFKLLMYCW